MPTTRRYSAAYAAPNVRHACPGTMRPTPYFCGPAVRKALSRYAIIQTSASCRALSHSDTRIKLGYPSQFGTWSHQIQRPTASAPWFGTILAFVNSHPRRVRLPSVTGAKKHGKRQEKACLGEKFPRILARCLLGAQRVGRLADVPSEHSALTPGTTRLRNICRPVLPHTNTARHKVVMSFDGARNCSRDQSGNPLRRTSRVSLTTLNRFRQAGGEAT